MALIDMKRPKLKGSQRAKDVVSANYEKYPYGLRISLEGPDIEKLGSQLDDVQLGGTVTITAKAEVVSYNVGGNLYDGERSEDTNLSFQIQKLQVIPTAKEADNSLKAIKQRLRSM